MKTRVLKVPKAIEELIKKAIVEQHEEEEDEVEEDCEQQWEVIFTDGEKIYFPKSWMLIDKNGISDNWLQIFSPKNWIDLERMYTILERLDYTFITI